MLTFSMDAFLVAVLQHPLHWHIRCRLGASTPSHTINRLKMLKRLMYGAAGIGLLLARLQHSA